MELTPETLASLFLNGILLAGLYATMSYGLALIYGVMKIINLAHAGVMMLGAYFAYVLIENTSISPFLVPVITVPVFVLIGMGLYRLVVRRVVTAPPISSLLLLFGVWLIIQNFAYLVFGSDTRTIYTEYTLTTIKVGSIPVSVNRLIVFGVAIVAVIVLQQFLTRTYTGKAIRATAQDAEASKLNGIDTNRILLLAFGLGIGLAALAGSLMAFIYAFDPDFGRSQLLKSFCIIVLGGLESFVGVALGALILAMTESFSIIWVMPAMQDFISFVLLVVVLIVMPGGIMSLFKRRA